MSEPSKQATEVHEVQITSSPPLGPLVEKFGADDILDVKEQISDEERPVIAKCSLIASYSWMVDNNTTILVPGIEFE